MRNRDEPANGPMGLTKIEAAAIAAMQGMLANPETMRDIYAAAVPRHGLGSSDVLAEYAGEHANALFDELDAGEAETDDTHLPPPQCDLCGGIPAPAVCTFDDCPHKEKPSYD